MTMRIGNRGGIRGKVVGNIEFRHLRVHEVRWFIYLDVEATKDGRSDSMVEDSEIDANLVHE